MVLAVNPSLGIDTLKDYIALARAKPGQLFYASSGAGGPNHLAGEIFKQMAGLDIMHVPYPGTGAAIPAVISNQVGAMWGFLAGLLPFIRAGSLKALAIGSRERSPALPEVPTVAEAGVPGYEASSWIGLLAPGGDAATGRHAAVGGGQRRACRTRRCAISWCATAPTSSSARPRRSAR